MNRAFAKYAVEDVSGVYSQLQAASTSSEGKVLLLIGVVVRKPEIFMHDCLIPLGENKEGDRG